MRRRRWILWGIGGGLLALMVLAILGRRGDEQAQLSWDAVSRGDLRETLTASGEIQSRIKINVGTSVMGEIKAIHVKDGQDVRAGDPLVTIDHERLKQEWNRATALLEAQRKEADRQEATRAKVCETFERMERLHRSGLVSDEEYRQAKLNRDSAVLSLEVARANVRQSEANLAAMHDALAKAVLRAPISGRVTGLKAEKGETAIPGQSNLPGAVLMVISDMKELVAEIKVNESEVVRLKPGQTAQVSVESLPGRVFPGTVYEVATAAERFGQDANMYKVKVALDMTAADVSRLRPGMSARAVVLTGEVKDVLRVPLQAVLEREGDLEEAQRKGLLSPESRSVVFVVEGNRALERPVVTGIANTQFIEVKEGVALGDRVLTGPVRKLKELKNRATVSLRRKSDTELEREARTRKGARP